MSSIDPFITIFERNISIKVNKEFHPAKSGYLSLRHCSNLYMLSKEILVKPNKFAIHLNISSSKYVIQEDYFVFCLLLTGDILFSNNVTHN